jgi:very-short-patch-repair endonuclease
MRLATRQHGVVARRQLMELGFGETAIKTRLSDHRLSALHGEVYAVGHMRVPRRGWWWAAVLAYGPEALLSHRSAAAFWGLAREARSRVEITAPTGRQGVERRKRLWIHRCRIDAEDRAAVVTGIPVTTVARTLFDLAEVESLKRLERAWEEADRLKLLRVREVERVCERGYGRRALKPIRRLLSEMRAPAEGRSPLEERFHVFCQEYRLPEPSRNVIVLGREVDALWPAAKLVGELDSWEHHSHRAAFERDRARDPKFLIAGYRTIRITHWRLDREAPTLATEIHQLLRTGTPSPDPSG